MRQLLYVYLCSLFVGFALNARRPKTNSPRFTPHK